VEIEAYGMKWDWDPLINKSIHLEGKFVSPSGCTQFNTHLMILAFVFPPVAIRAVGCAGCI
jgi:hypothetical protein